MPDDISRQPVDERLEGIMSRLREKLIRGNVFDQEAARDLEELAKLAAAFARRDEPR